VAGLMISLLVVVMIGVPWLLADGPVSGTRPNREAQLWFALGLVQMAIWSTLGPAQVLATALRTRGLLGPVSTTGLVLAGVAGVLLWTRRRPELLEIVAAVTILAAYLMVLVRTGLSPEERTHLFEYGLVALLAYEALTERLRAGRRTPRPWALALLLAVALGILDEALQMLVPNRAFDPRDILFNSIAATMALTSVSVMGTARRLVRDRRLSR